MKSFKKMLDNRVGFLYILSFVIIILFIYQIAHLTLIKGDYYRELSDSKRIREVRISPLRGEIKDKFGRLLAGNKTSFTVQLLKDEIPKADKNDICLLLSMILEEEGEYYDNDFPILLNRIYFKDSNQIISNKLTVDEIITNRLIENDLLKKVINYRQVFSDENIDINYHVGKRILNKIYKRESECPIAISENGKGFVFKDTDIERRNNWLNEQNIDTRLSAEDAIIDYLKRNPQFIRGLYEDSIASKQIFEVLIENNLADDLFLQPYAYSFDEDYLSIKKDLINKYKGISFKTTAKEDFENILLQTEIDKLISKQFVYEDDELEEVKIDIVGKIVEELSKKNVFLPVDYAEDEKGNINYFKKENADLEKYYKKYGDGEMLSNKVIFEHIIKENSEIIATILEDKQIKIVAQRVLIAAGINTRISIANWEYIPLIQKKTWLKGVTGEEIEFPTEVFDKIKKRYRIKGDLTPFEARLIMNMNSVLLKQGYRAYEPVRIAVGISKETVSKIKENQINLKGIAIEVESTRYYPKNENSSHLLGYMGRISQKNEIEKYIDILGYAPDDLIGKTGIEQKFETYLKGKEGYKKLEVDVFGNTIDVKEEVKAEEGNSLFLTIDSKLQEVAENCLEKALYQIREGGTYESKWGNYKYREPFSQATSGALVAVDVKTGEIVSMVNYPSYDPNLFASGITKENWKELTRNELSANPLAPKPLYNIAMQTAIQPGSVFKMVTALAGLKAGIDPYQTIHTLGFIELGNRTFKCWIWPKGTHGNENMMQALRDSCNYYFYTIVLGQNLRTGKKIDGQVGYKDILDMARTFGLDDRTGIEIDVPREKSGGVPNPDLKKKASQIGLRNYLKKNIEKYLVPDITYTPDQIDRMIETISDWALEEEIPTRGEVIRRLIDLKLVAEESIEGKNLTDVIKYDYLNDSKWKTGDSLNIAIGQGQNAYTPLQMARYVTMLANGGHLLDLTIVDHMEDSNGNKYNIKREENEEVVVPKEDLEIVQKGMLMVSKEGTARSVFREFPVDVAAKTGSAQKDGINPETGEKYDNYGWFVAYAPFDDPQIAVAAVAFQSGSGGVIGPAVRDIIAEYLGMNENVPEYIPEGNIGEN